LHLAAGEQAVRGCQAAGGNDWASVRIGNQQPAVQSGDPQKPKSGKQRPVVDRTKREDVLAHVSGQRGDALRRQRQGGRANAVGGQIQAGA
jgi:hypothetical protein